ncbi:hypothetical protein C427_2757 [Paraglaciecola psychrophila 170]|uniref:Uncharacterized protein n=1 Tax=Paraglaciecola psychrophila 170 TaxID=1129794 RepID=K7A1F3_9ALTE|nr:hypothetical protein C427_2757 [Paraglaciecola psychrophila 170]GAC36227.1 hypothetical protein GPSY_0589 [Paraglaciecola psychrophila 170]
MPVTNINNDTIDFLPAMTVLNSCKFMLLDGLGGKGSRR